MTKKEARAHKAHWLRAATQGRIVRFFESEYFRSFPTVAEAQAAVTDAHNAGLGAEIVSITDVDEG